MRELKNHPSPDQLDSYDKYPCYYENDLELVYIHPSNPYLRYGHQVPIMSV